MKRALRTLTVLLAVSSAGCTIIQEVEPVSVQPQTVGEVCVVENPDVREGFLATYRQALHNKGFSTRLLDPGTPVDVCPVTSTYVARWSWDLTIYMAYARIRVFDGGAGAGEALYDATGGGGRMDKFIDAEPKILELVNELFPG